MNPVLRYILVILRDQNIIKSWSEPLLYLLVSTRAVIGQFSGPYSHVRPAKI